MQKLRETQNNKTGKAASDGLAGRCDRSDTKASSIPPRPDDRYPERVSSDSLWPVAA